MPDEPNPDPLNLDSVDREIRIDKLRRQIDEVAGEESFSGKVADCDPKLEEAFLEQVLAVENHGFVSPLDTLAKAGFQLPPAAELDDAALTTKLWLLTDGLREELMVFGLPFGNCHLDVLGSGGEEDVILQMRYYEDDEERTRWAKEFPDFPMPTKEKPPFDRNRHLPKAFP
jgi:hypothetical protein